MDDENRIDKKGKAAQKKSETAELRMQQASEFWSKYDDDTLPPVLQAFKVRAVEFVRALPDRALKNEEGQYSLPPELEDKAGEVSITPSLKERLWMRVFSEERQRRGIADPNDDAEPSDHALAGPEPTAPVAAPSDEPGDEQDSRA